MASADGVVLSEMIPISKALRFIRRETAALADERIRIEDAVSRILAEDIIADDALPPFDRSQMDGYAVRSADVKSTPVTLQIVGESAAGRGWHKRMQKGQAVRIMTGAPVPAGADAVQKVELTEADEKTVTVLEPAKKGNFIVRRGAEVRKGEKVIAKGQCITPENIAVLAAFGYAKVRVAKQPRVAIMSTGSEIVAINHKPGRDQIRNSNSIMLEALCRRAGAATTIVEQVRDDLSDLKSQISNARKKSDVLIITGGVSVGKYDLTKQALTELGAEIFFEKVRLKPGKPAVFARLGKTLVFGLPGNPVSSAVTFHLFVRLAIRQMQSAASILPENAFAVLAADTKGAMERDTYLPSSTSTDASGRLVATPLKWIGSSDFIGYSNANALIFVPAGQVFKTGDVVQIVFL